MPVTLSFWDFSRVLWAGNSFNWDQFHWEILRFYMKWHWVGYQRAQIQNIFQYGNHSHKQFLDKQLQNECATKEEKKPLLFVCVALQHHGRWKDSFHGGPLGDFFQNFSRGGKSGEICFYPLETKKKTFFCCNFQNPPPLPPFPRPCTAPKCCSENFSFYSFLGVEKDREQKLEKT